jgi:hypothetical protein
MHVTLKLITHLCYGLLGAGLVYHGLSQSAMYRSLIMRWRGLPARPMTLPFRVIMVLLGGVLLVDSLLLAFGLVQ